MNKNNNEKNKTLDVVEKFISINGEGYRAGQLAVFLRFKGCNLNCSYCDTLWANKKDVPYEQETIEQLVDYVMASGVRNVTLTGGEPLLQKNINELIQELVRRDRIVEIETNGSIDINNFYKSDNVTFTMDYKTGTSGMEEYMCCDNFNLLRENDTVKFVSGSIKDLEKAKYIIDKYNLSGKCHIFISPVFGLIDPIEIVEFMKDNNMNNVNLQLQLHKFIWDPDKKGV